MRARGRALQLHRGTSSRTARRRASARATALPSRRTRGSPPPTSSSWSAPLPCSSTSTKRPSTWTSHGLERVLASDPEISAVMAVDTFGNPAGMAELESLAADAGSSLHRGRGLCTRRLRERPAGRFVRAGRLLQLPSPQDHHDRRRGHAGHERRAGGSRSLADTAITGSASLTALPVFVDPGDNLRMTDFQAALGVTQMAAARRTRRAALAPRERGTTRWSM